MSDRVGSPTDSASGTLLFPFSDARTLARNKYGVYPRLAEDAEGHCRGKPTGTFTYHTMMGGSTRRAINSKLDSMTRVDRGDRRRADGKRSGGSSSRTREILFFNITTDGGGGVKALLCIFSRRRTGRGGGG